MKKRPNKQTCVRLITEEIGKGRTFTESLDYFRQLWTKLPKSTFANYWNEAQEQHQAKRKVIEKKKQEQTINHELERNKQALITKDRIIENALNDIEVINQEIKELQAVVITGKKIGSHIEVTTQSDVNNAKRTIGVLQANKVAIYEMLNKMQGYHEAIKTENKHEGIPPVQWNIVKQYDEPKE